VAFPAQAREKTRPQDAVPTYNRAALADIATTKRDGYRKAVSRLKHVAEIAADGAFAEIIAEIRRDHGRKRTLMGMFDKEGW